MDKTEANRKLGVITNRVATITTEGNGLPAFGCCQEHKSRHMELMALLRAMRSQAVVLERVLRTSNN